MFFVPHDEGSLKIDFRFVLVKNLSNSKVGMTQNWVRMHGCCGLAEGLPKHSEEWLCHGEKSCRVLRWTVVRPRKHSYYIVYRQFRFRQEERLSDYLDCLSTRKTADRKARSALRLSPQGLGRQRPTNVVVSHIAEAAIRAPLAFSSKQIPETNACPRVWLVPE
jgi:hypothetical protein